MSASVRAGSEPCRSAVQHPEPVDSTRGASVNAAATRSRWASTSAPGSRCLRMIPGHRDIASVAASPGATPFASGEASVTRALRPSPATSATARPQSEGSLLRSACRAKSGTERTA
jgi:hypothetical protein